MAVQFETDVGIRVGLLICFDINFLEPVNLLDVDVIAYPVAWTDELPFLTGEKIILIGNMGPIIYLFDGRSSSRH